MNSRSGVAITGIHSVVAMLLAASGVDNFAMRMWPHHRALHELATAVTHRSAFALATRTWEFSPSADGGYRLHGLERAFLAMSGSGWLERHEGLAPRYRVSERLRAWGDELQGTLASEDRARLELAAHRLRAALTTSSK